MYPTVVTVLVETQRSTTDIRVISPSNASTLAGPVGSGAHPTSVGRLTFEAESQRSCVFQSQDRQECGLEAILEVEESTASG